MKKMIDIPGISFADSTYNGCIITEKNDVLVILDSWDGKKIKIYFYKVLEFTFKYAGAPEGLYELPYDSHRFTDPKHKNNEVNSLKSPFKIYHIEDIESSPMIEVIAESVKITKLDHYYYELYNFFSEKN